MIMICPFCLGQFLACGCVAAMYCDGSRAILRRFFLSRLPGIVPLRSAPVLLPASPDGRGWVRVGNRGRQKKSEFAFERFRPVTVSISCWLTAFHVVPVSRTQPNQIRAMKKMACSPRLETNTGFGCMRIWQTRDQDGFYLRLVSDQRLKVA